MIPNPILAPWTRLFASLAIEVILVFALSALLAHLVRSASGQRMVWRMSFVALAGLVRSVAARVASGSRDRESGRVGSFVVAIPHAAVAWLWHQRVAREWFRLTKISR